MTITANDDPDDPSLGNLLSAISSDFADATSPATVRDVSHALELITVQQEALVVLTEIVSGMDLSADARKKLTHLSSVLTLAVEMLRENVDFVYDTHKRAQFGE